jgi:hypothetical protein
MNLECRSQFRNQPRAFIEPCEGAFEGTRLVVQIPISVPCSLSTYALFAFGLGIEHNIGQRSPLAFAYSSVPAFLLSQATHYEGDPYEPEWMQATAIWDTVPRLHRVQRFNNWGRVEIEHKGLEGEAELSSATPLTPFRLVLYTVSRVQRREPLIQKSRSLSLSRS